MTDWQSVPNEGMDTASVPDGRYEVRAAGFAPVPAEMGSGMWFRAERNAGGHRQPLWFRPTEYRALPVDTTRVPKPPLPGTVETVGAATITHRPDILYQEQQAAAQGEPGYLPVKQALAAAGSTHVLNGSGGTHQAPEPLRKAEPAHVGMERR